MEPIENQVLRKLAGGKGLICPRCKRPTMFHMRDKDRWEHPELVWQNYTCLHCGYEEEEPFD